MEQSKMRKFKLFWAWEDEKEEAWLRKMAQEGWHLISPEFPGFYTFKEGEARDIVYRLDFITSTIDREEYRQLFDDAGWEHVGEMFSWQYFRKAAKPGKDPEIYTDPESKIQKYMRLFGYMLIFMPIWVILLPRLDTLSKYGLSLILVPIFVVIAIVWAYAFLRIGLRIRELNQLRLSSKK
jgi:hypothetical protein